MFNYQRCFSGKKYATDKGILCEDKTKKCLQFNENVDPSVINDFQHGSFRGQHICIPSKVNFFIDGVKITYNLSDVIGDGHFLNKNYDGVLQGILDDAIHCNGISYTKQVGFYRNGRKLLFYFHKHTN